MDAAHDDRRNPNIQRVGLVAAPIAAAIGMALSAGALGRDGSIVFGLLIWMAGWWLTVAVPLPATALLPLVLLPLTGVRSLGEAAAPYANEVIFLFAGGFTLAIALERHGLSTRFARVVLRLAGESAPALIAALMLTTAIISAFVSNTAAAAAMLPVAIALARRPKEDPTGRLLAPVLVLSVAYAANIGGALTLVGSPPNAIAAQFVERATGTPVTFATWLAIGGPVGAVQLAVTWILLSFVLFPMRHVRVDLSQLPAAERLDWPARLTLGVFALTVLAWLSRPLWSPLLPGLTDAGIAVTAAVVLLTIPRSARTMAPLLEWSHLSQLPWGVLVLFGGGLSLAAAVDGTGVADWLGTPARSLESLPLPIVVATIAGVCCFASEIASNTALAATAMPIVGALAEAIDSPIAALAIPAALGASFAFMLPVGTPPNAMAYATGHVTSGQMARTGVLLNLVGIVVITLVASLLL